MLGLETALPIVAALLVETGDMTWRDLARVMSTRPAEIAGLMDADAYQALVESEA